MQMQTANALVQTICLKNRTVLGSVFVPLSYTLMTTLFVDHPYQTSLSCQWMLVLVL